MSDALGRRRAKFVGSVGTGYLSANDQEIAEYSASFALLRRYIPGAGLDEPVARVDGGTGTVNYLHTDGLGSVIAESSGTSGTIIIGSKYAYGPFGESATVAGGFIRYTGRRLDPETGLYHNRARTYSTKLGRFLQPDSSGPSDGPNLYAYTTNAPLNRTDPSGLAATGFEASWNVSSTMLLRQSGMMGLNFDANYDAALPAFGYLRVNGTVGEQIGAWSGFAAGYAVNTLGIGAAIGYSVNYAALWAAGKAGAAGATKGTSWGLSISETKTALSSAQEAYKGSTVVGHALSKHAGRNPDTWGTMTGSMKTWNEQGMAQLRHVIRGSGQFTNQTYNNGIKFMEERLPDGRGVRLNTDGSFKGFLD